MLVASFIPGTSVLAAAGDGASSNIQLFDTDNNGVIDQITFDIANPNGETWSLNGASPYGLSATQGGSALTISSVTIPGSATANPVTVQVDLNEAGMTTDTDGVNANAIELIYTQAGYGSTPNIQDSVDEELNAIATGDTGATDTEADAAPPVIIGLEYYSSGSNGTVDRIDVDFSETVTWNYGTLQQFAITNNGLTGLDSDGQPDSASGSGTSTITLTTSGTTNLTGVGSGTEPTTDYAQSPTAGDRIKDAAGNDTVAMPQTTIVDGADPAILANDYEDLNGDGTVDNIYLQFTEDIDDDVFGMTSADFSVTLNTATTGQGGSEMVETLNVGTADDDEIDIAFTNGLTFDTNNDYEINVGPNKIGDANGNPLPTLTNFDCNDGAAPVFTSVSPATNDYVNDAVVSYSLSENLFGGFITWTKTSGPGTNQTSNLTGAELNAGTHTDITLTNAPTLVDGTIYTVSFDGGDGSNPAAQVNSTGVTYDTTSPTPTVSVDTIPIYEGDLTQQVTITYDEAMDNSTTPTVSFTAPGNWGGPTGGAWSTTTFTNDTYTVNFTHDGSPENTLPETITVGATSGATDLAGNADNSGNTSFGVDTVDPVPTLTSILPLYTNGSNTITFTATDSPGTGIASTTCSVDGATFTACTTGDALSTLGGWGGLADGPFTVVLRVTDTAGNVDTDTDATCSKDTTPPVTTITSAPTPTNGTQTFTFTATDAGGSGVASTTCAVDGATFAACTTGDAYSTLTGWGALPEGAFTLTVRTTDNVGLTHDDTAAVTKDTVPTAAPGAPDMQAASDSGTSNSDDLTNDTTPTFDVVASEAGSTMTLISDVDGTIGTRVGSGAITASVLTEGAHGITVVETDTAGNSSPASAALGIQVDTTAPNLAETTPVSDPTSDATPNLSFSSDEAGAMSWAGGCNSTTTTAAAATQTITLDSDGAGSDLADATYNCTLTVTDGAGNPSAGLGLTAFTVDTTAPTGTATVGTDPLYEGDLVQEVTITYDEAMDPASTPTITFAGTAGAFTSNADGFWPSATTWTESFTLTDADEEVTGATVYSSGATDFAGIPEGAPVAGTFDVDTLAPTLTTVTIASNNATDTTTAGVGDDVTLTITGSETIQQPVVAYTSGGVAVADTPSTYFPAWTAAYTANVADTEGAVAYTIDFADLAGNNGVQVTATTDGSAVTYDNSAPTVVTYSPADDATGVGISSNLDLTFDDNIVAGAGNVVIYRASDDAVIETIDITTASATFDGTTGVSINPAANFAYSTAYYVQIDATAIDNTVGLTYAGIADKTTWNFTTAAAPPAPTSSGGSAGGRVTRPTTTTTDTTTTETEVPLVFSDVAGHWAQDYIYEAKDDGYVEGYADETFKPDQYITRSEAAKLIAMWLDANIGDDVCQDGLFSDVDCSLWYAKYVVYLSDAGIIEGYGDGTFGPALYINRAEALKMMLFAKALQDSDIADTINPFSDVSVDQWFYNYVMVGYKLSIVQGYEDGTFGPGRNITRAEFTKIFVETLLNN